MDSVDMSTAGPAINTKTNSGGREYRDQGHSRSPHWVEIHPVVPVWRKARRVLPAHEQQCTQSSVG